MLVTLNTVKFITPNNILKAKNHQITTSSLNNISGKLPNFDSVGRSLVSFKSSAQNQESEENLDELDLNSKTIEELKELKDMRIKNRAELEKSKADAKAKLDEIKAWDSSYEYLKQQNDAEAEINAKDLSRFWNPFQCRAIREKHYDRYSRKKSHISKLIADSEHYIKIIKMVPLSDKEAKAFIASVDAIIEQKIKIEEQEKRLKGIEGVKNAIEAMNNARGGLDDRVAGYEYEKDEIRRGFIHPLAQSQKTPEIKVPSSVMLYGASGTGKTTFLQGLKHEAKESGYAHVVEMSAVENSREFKDEIKSEFGKAKTRYLELGDDEKPKRVRTILLFNDAEKHFGMSYEQAKAVYGDLIDAADANRLKHINNDTSVIDDFKAILDNCSGAPELSPNGEKDKSLTNSAVTIFITTNYPHLIDRDLIRKFDIILPINPAKNINFEEVMKHYFKKCSDVLEEVKKAAENPNFKANDLRFLHSYLTKKSINKLVKMAENETLDKLFIDWENIPYDKISKDFNPSKAKGAFDNKQLCDLAIAALNDYIEEPERMYSAHYYARLFNEPRKLDPVRYKHFVDIFNALAPLNKQEDVEQSILEKREKELLLGLEKIGQLSEKDKKKLDYIRNIESQELKYLEFKEKNNSLSDEDKVKLENMRHANENDNNVYEDEDY